MRKFLIGLVLVVAVAFGGIKLYTITNYGGTAYYTRITTNGTKIIQRTDDGSKLTDYHYDQPGYDENGQARTLAFNGNKARPLRRGAYLKLTYNAKKGVTRWEAVSAVDVPAKALAKLK